MINEWTIKIVDTGYKLDRDIYILRRVGTKTEIFRGDTIETIGEGEASKPSFSMSPEMLQEFANVLNKLGINPRKEFVEGKLEATEKHLEDMRKIVFGGKLKGQTKPKKGE